MPALKLRKKTTKTSKISKPTKSRKLKTKGSKRLKVKAITRSKVRLSRKPKPPPPHPDETSVRLGPHHVDRHPYPAGIQVHPAPAVHIFVPAATSHRNTLRHH